MSEKTPALQVSARETCLFLIPLNGSLAIILADTILSDDFGRRAGSMELAIPAGILLLIGIYLLGRSHGRLDAFQRRGADIEPSGEHGQPMAGEGRGWQACMAVLTLGVFAQIALVFYARVSPVL